MCYTTVMSSGGKKHAPSGARAKQRKKRGKKNGVQIPLPVGNSLSRAGAAVADVREAAVCAERPVAGGAPPQKAASDGDFPTSSGDFLTSGRAFLLAACVCLLLLVLESGRAARYLDEFAPGGTAEKAASLLRTIGKASGAARLGAWEDALIRYLAGNTPAVRQKTPLSAGADGPDGRSRGVETIYSGGLPAGRIGPDGSSRGVETARAPAREPASGPAETAGVRAGPPAAPQVSVLPATRAASGQQGAPDASRLSAEHPAVHGPQPATAPQVTDAAAQQTVSAAVPQAKTAALRAPTAAQAETAALRAPTATQAETAAPQTAGTALPFPDDAPQESAGAGASVPGDSALSGATLASLPEISGLEGAGRKRKTVLLVGDSMMGWGLGHMLERSMRAYPWISVKRYSRPSTGLCRTTDVDWPKYLGELVTEHSPDLVVISIGANDGFSMTDLNRRACTVFTPAWEAEYRRRAEDFVHIAGSRGAKVLWVGLPVAGVDKIEKVLRTVSRLQQEACAKFDFVSYLDVRAVLADKDGRYTTFRPGNNAEPVRIRATDKVHVSAAGGKLLTDHIMPSVLKTLGSALQGGADNSRGTARAKSVARAGKAGG
ncbi:MAG: DUF459 domain-containing protein [Desulfovibrio sp.]|nr:DUF459 domain-containing protein [Desulfovibrio sp.]